MSTTASCPLCGNTKRMRRPKQLYGHDVCKKCCGKFANRRQFAYAIDLFLSYIVEFIAGAIIGIGLGITGLISNETVVTAFNIFLIIVFTVVVLAKDGFFGYSPGKALMGVQAVDGDTGVPIGFGVSIKRNLPTLIPFIPLVIALQLMKGHRMGDGWAHSKVIWRKYANNPVFKVGHDAQDVGFGPANVSLPPVQQSANPYQAPRQ